MYSSTPGASCVYGIAFQWRRGARYRIRQASTAPGTGPAVSGDCARARAFLEARFAQEDSLILRAVDERDRPLGFTQLLSTLNTVRLTSRWMLNDLFVAPEACHQGAGKALLEVARAHCEAVGVGEMRLASQVDNRAAKTL